jgi:hypothetical protein
MKLVGNSSSIINWKELVDGLRKQPGRQRGNDQQDDIHHNPKVAELRKQWETAGYENNHAVGWIDYDVPQELIDKFAEWLNVNPIGAWITSVPPGYCVPWHYDITDDEEQLTNAGIPLRYTCHISEPKFGQVFVLEDHVFYNESQGNVYQWTDWQQWHGGMNMGLEAKFLFNFMAYAK